MAATHTKSRPKAQAKPATSRRPTGTGKPKGPAKRPQSSKTARGAVRSAPAKASAAKRPAAPRPAHAKATAPRKVAAPKARTSSKAGPRTPQVRSLRTRAGTPQKAAGKSQPPPASTKKSIPTPAATPARAKPAAHAPAPSTHRAPAETNPQPTKAQVDAARQKLSRQEMGELRQALVAERARLTGVVEGLREQSLLRHDEVNHEEDGTDAFIRLFDLDRASNEQSQIVRIDAAIRAIDEGAYGSCEKCGCRIEKPRLLALPFVKTCIKCQSEAEHGHRGRVSARHRLWE